MRYDIMLIGEAYGEAEERAGKPFVGTAGKFLDGILDEVGIARASCYITNVVNERPPDNNFSVYYDGKNPTPKLLEEYQRLYNEIASVRPNVIVTLGSEATKAVCGASYASIQHWRGSVLATPHGKCVPTIHPAAAIRDWLFRPTMVADFERIKKESLFPDVRITKRELIIPYKFEEACAYLEQLKGAEYVAFDIETETDQITCVGFSPRPGWAVSIPFWYGASGSLWSEGEELQLWERIREILESEAIKKIGQNGSYDIEFLRRTMSIDVRGYEFDTMLAFHCLYPELPKGLDYLVSIYTDHPYYKFGRKATSMDDHFRYNATDACLTFECFISIREELVAAGATIFYHDYLHALVAPLLRMQERGVGFDEERRDELRSEYRGRLGKMEEHLCSLVGRELNINSPKQMKEWLYGSSPGGLALKAIYKKRKQTGEETIAADEEALEELYKKTGNEAIKVVLEMRELNKILSTYLEVKLDPDKRIRCSYLIHGTETGRLSSRQTARGTGTNLQNIPPGDIRRLFTADHGCTLINADLSQAEARVVAYLAGEERLIKVFDSGGDIHRKNASNIFGVKEEDVTDDQRQLAKRVVHASNYGMGPVTFAKQLGITKVEAQRLLNRYFATYPGIKNWQRAIGDEVKRKRCLTNPLGRKRVFFGRYGEPLVKEGLAFIPQSTVADVVNQALIELDREGFEILMQVHDSLVIQVKDTDIEVSAARIIAALQRPIEINGRILVIPVDVKTGKNWEDMEKMKKLGA